MLSQETTPGLVYSGGPNPQKAPANSRLEIPAVPFELAIKINTSIMSGFCWDTGNDGMTLSKGIFFFKKKENQACRLDMWSTLERTDISTEEARGAWRLLAELTAGGQRADGSARQSIWQHA